MSIGIDLISGCISTSINSHKANWAHLIANQLRNKYPNKTIKVLHKDESWDDYDYMVIYHGMEYAGGYNVFNIPDPIPKKFSRFIHLFGGAKENIAKKFERLINYNGKMVSIDYPMPNYGAFGMLRSVWGDDYWKQVNWKKIENICEKIPMMRHPYRSDQLILGDSHAFSAYKPPMMVIRLDKKTLYGALKTGLENLIKNNGINPKKLNHLSLYFGNIDIRHHLARRLDCYRSIVNMMNEYEKQIKELNIPNIELVEALPIENESRKIPKAGYYKDTPFYGKWSLRNNIRNYFNDRLKILCDKNQWILYKHHKVIINDLGELDFNAMEKPRSVHLNGNFYRWNLRENKRIKY